MTSLLIGSLSLLLTAQAPQASLVGTVTDAKTGQPLPGALISLTDLDRGQAASVDGRFVFGDVPAGPQHLRVRSVGYETRTLHALVPQEGLLEINLALQPVPVRLGSVRVNARLALCGTEPSDSVAFPDKALTSAAVRNHPLLSEPDALLALGGGHAVLAQETPQGLGVQGGAPDQTSYVIDGFPVFNPYHSAGLVGAWNPDALARVELSIAPTSVASPETLSGTVSAATRSPGDQARTAGGLSTTQARATVDGPLGSSGAGYLLAIRSGLPDFLAPDDPSYLRGGTSDVLAKIESPAWGGRLMLLGYQNENALDAARAQEDPLGSSGRNVFEWESRSLGIDWRSATDVGRLEVKAWLADADVGSSWSAAVGEVDMSSLRSDAGVAAALERSGPDRSTRLGLRLERSRTHYAARTQQESPAGALGWRGLLGALTVDHTRPLTDHLSMSVGVSSSAAHGSIRLAPRALLRWRASGRAQLALGASRRYQYAQSLRNTESLVGNIFPVDLFVSAGSPGVPVARGDRVFASFDASPLTGVRIGASAYARTFDGLLLVAPVTGEPFALGDFATGSGSAVGVSIEASAAGRRFWFVGSYGWQRVRLTGSDAAFTPDYGDSHLIEGGLIVFPSASASLRLGASAGIGRRTSRLAEGLEWEACNLEDKGCEFSGSPRTDPDALGAVELPSYVRVDATLRKHWHLEVAGRDALIGLFGSMTNLLGRSNVLAYTRDPTTGERVAVSMRPRSPLVIGVDWRF